VQALTQGEPTLWQKANPQMQVSWRGSNFGSDGISAAMSDAVCSGPIYVSQTASTE
jgi:hypothetical protein